MSALVALTNLGSTWPDQAGLLGIPDFHLERSESLFLKRPSGSGKTVLPGPLGGVQKPDRGSIRLLGEDLEKLSVARRNHFRVDHTDYIFQQFNLLPLLSVRENVELPYHFSTLRRQRTRERHSSPTQVASHLFGQLDPGGELHVRRADSLSIGQQQRVAAVRMLIGQLELMIADKPTSVLGVGSCEAFFQLLFVECREASASLLLVSRDQSPTGLFDHSLPLSDLNCAARPVGL